MSGIFRTFNYMQLAVKHLLLLAFSGSTAFAQNYDTYFTGNPTDVVTLPKGGVCLMGGATEDDNAMIWFLQQANGGDVLVLRASGADGYNDYFYTDLGVPVNSVESVVFNNAAAASEPYIHQKIQQAEAIWFAGGDQWDYISYWRDTAIDSLINLAVSERNIVIGGTSAGMAILGEVYFTAENGTVTSATALNNPYAGNVTIDNAPFLEIPFMNNVITDTHYDNPDRRGRHVVFMARMLQDFGLYGARGIACEEYVAVCIDTLGRAHVYGGYPTYDEQAYFIRVNCAWSDVICAPETCVAATPLTWSCSETSLTVYKVNGTSDGANYFDLNTWDQGSGGDWYDWYVTNGTLNTAAALPPECSLSFDEYPIETPEAIIYPNPTALSLTISTKSHLLIENLYLTDVTGRQFGQTSIQQPEAIVSTQELAPGVYQVHYQINGQWRSVRFLVN